MNANRKSPHSHRLGLNKFADITPQEFSKKYLQAPKDVPRHINMADKELKEEQHSCDHPPASWDWREKGVITDVKHQGLCDCVESEGCSSGWPDDSFVWVLEHGGIATDADYPYRAKECRYKANKGIYGGGNCSKYWVNHFVLLVGYGSADGVDYWIAKNSWGEDWGKDGYIWIQRNTGNFSGVCGMNYFPVYPTKKKSETLVSAGIKAHRRVDHSPL
ncbi:hypothetical protein JHK87_013017 [Glycine soja]|nr:hypothetical protein JHK87_013017 [Glycine soja]